MRKIVTISLIAVAMILLGSMIVLAALYAANFHLPSLAQSPSEQQSMTVDAPFSAMDVQTDIGNVSLCPSVDGSCRVEYNGLAGVDYKADVLDDTLTVTHVDTRKWFERISFFTPKTTLTLYLPEKAYTALSVDTDAGDLCVPADFAFETVTFKSDTGDLECCAAITGALSVMTDTGDVTISQCAPASLELYSNTGDVELTGLSVAGMLSADTDTGDLTLADCTANAMALNTATGDLSVTDCTAVSIVTRTSTGDQMLTNTIADDQIHMDSNTGEVRLDRCDTYVLEIKTSTGDVHGELLTMKNFQGATNTGHVSVPQANKGDTNGLCYVETDTGDISFSVVSDTVRRDNFD